MRSSIKAVDVRLEPHFMLCGIGRRAVKDGEHNEQRATHNNKLGIQAELIVPLSDAFSFLFRFQKCANSLGIPSTEVFHLTRQR